MNVKFDNLPEGKKQRIIGVCIEEFALNGYDSASTNTIVRKADISKGILFHYFGSKKNLFLYIYDYAMSFLIEKYYAIKESQPSDLFERLVWFSNLEMKIAFEEPLLYKMIFEAFFSMPESLRSDMTKIYETYYAQAIPFVLENIDTSKFKKDINPHRAIETVMLFMSGLTTKYLKEYNGKTVEEILVLMDKLLIEYNEYLDILKFGIYKN